MSEIQRQSFEAKKTITKWKNGLRYSRRPNVNLKRYLQFELFSRIYVHKIQENNTEIFQRETLLDNCNAVCIAYYVACSSCRRSSLSRSRGC